MYRFNRQSIILIFCSILVIIGGKTFAQLNTNGSFESSNVGIVSGTDVKGWLIQVATITPPPVFEIVSDTVKEGNRALKLSINGVGTNAWDIQAIADSIPVKQGTSYTYSIWAKAKKAGAQVNFTVGNYSYSEYGAIRPATLTTVWKKYTMQFTVSDDQSYIRAPIHFNYAADTGNVVYIDNLQIYDQSFGKTPIIVEAESGKIGSNFSVAQDGDITYVTTKTNYSGQVSPGDTIRMITYQLTFQDSGYYNLFARVKVGSGAYDDDSFFYGRGFGEKSDTSSTSWVFINGLAGAGFSASTDVLNGQGTAGSSVWKWVNVTKYLYSGNSPEKDFFVNTDSLSKTFQIGSREDGLYIDKFAFGKSNLYFTVKDLDDVLPGSTKLEDVDSSKWFQGPPLAEGASKFLGNVPGNDLNVFANYWNQLTPGNEGKWGTVAGLQDTTKWNWSGLDKYYNYAINNNLIFKDHNLIWGQQQPSWISGLDSAQQIKYIETWFRMVGQRYPKMDMIDVVNEPLSGHNPPDGTGTNANYIKALGGKGTTSWDWVINAFILARKYLPNAKLLINDYGIINDNSATTYYLKIINLLKDRGLIDGIGVQGHRFEFESANTATLKSNLDKLAATGLPIYISEMDLGNISDSGTPNDDTQLSLYKKIFPIVWEHSGVKGITLWGYIEGQMWQTTCWLVHTDGTPRSAFTWLVQYIKDNPNPTEVEETVETLPSSYTLKQNYPNPFNPSTNIVYALPKNSNVKLVIYDATGRRIATLVDENQSAGEHKIVFNAGNYASGVYFYQLRVNSTTITKSMVLLK
jgi:endo-1,4-beta-xylanase